LIRNYKKKRILPSF